MFEEFKDPNDDSLLGIVRLSDGAMIPIDERNKDYQEYLRWLEENN